MSTEPHARSAHYELRFQSLFDQGRALVFPCDARGHVEMDALAAPRAGAALNFRRRRQRQIVDHWDVPQVVP